MDADGFTIGEGDCNDCEPLVNPNAVEDLSTPDDDDCDGSLTAVLEPCDSGLGLDLADPVAVLEAIELCKVSRGADDWGVVSAAWVMPDGAPPPTDAQDSAGFHLGHGVMNDFGPNVAPRAGQRILVLSNGTARRPSDPGYLDVTSSGMGYQGNMPAGFPKAGPCNNPGSDTTAFDPTAIEAVIRAPSNATSFSFHFSFYAADYPGFVCSGFNDAFSVQVIPTPMGLSDGNVAFHGMDFPFSVNGAPFDVCGCMGGPPCMAGGQTFACTQGTMALMGNGFGADVSDNRGATGWMRTKVPIDPGAEITVRWAVWDAADGIFTATALIDNFTWNADGPEWTTPDP